MAQYIYLLGPSSPNVVSRPHIPKLWNFLRCHNLTELILWFWRKWDPVCENWSQGSWPMAWFVFWAQIALGHNQLIVQFMPATCPNLEFKNPTFLGQKNEVSTIANMCFWGGMHFFYKVCSFSHYLIFFEHAKRRVFVFY